MSGTYDLRRALALAENTLDADRWTAEEWLRLSRAYAASEWDICPHDWTGRQVREALNKRRPMAPNWDGDPSRPCNGKPMT